MLVDRQDKQSEISLDKAGARVRSSLIRNHGDSIKTAQDGVDKQNGGHGFEPHSPRPKSKAFKDFQIRWNEPLGIKGDPYMRRFVLNLKFFSIRLHIWYRSDDTRFMHNHGWNFITLILKGGYTDVTEEGKELLTAGNIRYRKADHLHFVGWPINPTITLLLCGPLKQKWGFKVNGRILRPLRFFSRYGHEEQEGEQK